MSVQSKTKDTTTSATTTNNNNHNATTTTDAAFYLNFCSLSRNEIIRLGNVTTSHMERKQAMIPIQQVTKEDILHEEPMTILEQFITILFLMLGVPNGIFSIPMLTYGIGKFLIGNVQYAFIILGIILIPLTIFPQSFIPNRLHSWMAIQVVKYFSFRLISTEAPPIRDHTQIKQESMNHTSTTSSSSSSSNNLSCRPQILVAPPHGVFPYGNLLAMIAWPTYTGHHFLGLAANAALRVPIFKQILCGMGVIDASRSSARRALEHFPYTIGISTGGVAEVFETTSDNECIVLKERIGLIKLAIRTGADLVPCYMFGNTKLLSCWAGEGIPYGRTILERISRKVGFALIVLYGRYGLPIPFRVPVLAVKGKAIPTYHIKCEEPSDDQISKIQNQLIHDMQKLFDDYKYLYGWENQQLVIK